MKLLSKEEYFAADDLPLTPVPMPPELYGKDAGFLVRSMAGDEGAALETQFYGKDPRQDPGGFRAELLIRCVVDEQGKPIFGEKDRERLMGRNRCGLERLFTEACKLNGFTKEEVDERAKN